MVDHRKIIILFTFFSMVYFSFASCQSGSTKKTMPETGAPIIASIGATVGWWRFKDGALVDVDSTITKVNDVHMKPTPGFYVSFARSIESGVERHGSLRYGLRFDYAKRKNVMNLSLTRASDRTSTLEVRPELETFLFSPFAQLVFNDGNIRLSAGGGFSVAFKIFESIGVWSKLTGAYAGWQMREASPHCLGNSFLEVEKKVDNYGYFSLSMLFIFGIPRLQKELLFEVDTNGTSSVLPEKPRFKIQSITFSLGFSKIF